MALGQFNAFAKSDVDFYPSHLRNAIKKTIDAIYLPINNGVYRSEFASSQAALLVYHPIPI